MTIPLDQREKISLFCNVSIKDVIETVDVKTIYEAPISFNKENLDERVLKYFKISSRKKVNLLPWKKITKLVLQTYFFYVSSLSSIIFLSIRFCE